MTKITLEKRPAGRYRVRCEGHATGSVEVCAAVSTLCCTLAGYLHNEPCEIRTERLEAGDAELVFYGGIAARDAFDMAKIGFLQIARSYPDYAQVEQSEIF